MTDKPDVPESKKVIPWLGLRSEPYTIDEKLAYELASIVIEWGRFETGLSADTAVMMAYPHIRALSDKPPRSFKQKIELWKRCVQTLYHGVKPYCETATEICSKGKMIAHARHAVIHGLWAPFEPHRPGEFRLSVHRDFKPNELPKEIKADAKLIAEIHADIRTVSDALYTFQINRMFHAHLKLLRRLPEPKP